MQVFRSQGTDRVHAIKLDDRAIICIPDGHDAEKKVLEITLDRTDIGVPITTCRISLLKWLELNEQAQRELVRLGWNPRLTNQILPRGA